MSKSNNENQGIIHIKFKTNYTNNKHMETTKVYALIPLFNITTPIKPMSIYNKSSQPINIQANQPCKQIVQIVQYKEKQIRFQIQNNFKVSNKPSFVLHQVLTDSNTRPQKNKYNNFYAIQFQQFELTFQQINQIVQNHQQLQTKLQSYQEMLKSFDWDKQALQMHSDITQVNDTQNIQSLIKKAKKYKDIKQENKKLKKLLQIQLDNTQKVRQQTQKTMKVLRNQFNALVAEMIKQRQKNETASLQEQTVQVQKVKNNSQQKHIR